MEQDAGQGRLCHNPRHACSAADHGGSGSCPRKTPLPLPAEPSCVRPAIRLYRSPFRFRCPVQRSATACVPHHGRLLPRLADVSTITDVGVVVLYRLWSSAAQAAVGLIGTVRSVDPGRQLVVASSEFLQRDGTATDLCPDARSDRARFLGRSQAPPRDAPPVSAPPGACHAGSARSVPRRNRPC